MENSKCKICFEKYDCLEHSPMILMMCGHTFCKYCVSQLKTRQCPNCREKIVLTKKNYDLIELLVQASSADESKASSSNELQFFYSIHHKRKFIEIESSEEWTCKGIYGHCKSSLDESKNKNRKRYNCIEFDHFDLCYKCLNNQEIDSSNSQPTCSKNVLQQNKRKFNDDDEDSDNDINIEKFYSSINHNHKFVEVESNEDWYCDGMSFYGKCKSSSKSNTNKKRFNCTECISFDLCDKCLKGEKVDFFRSLNHPHKFIKFDKSPKDWYCDGKTVFGRCYSKSVNKSLVGKLRFKCIECQDFDFCAECLSSTKKIDLDKEFTTPLHEHPFIKIKNCSYNSFRCGGKDLFGSCKSNSKVNKNNESIYHCTQCDIFLCSECLNYRISDVLKILNSRIFDTLNKF